jgi:hypothetical protein
MRASDGQQARVAGVRCVKVEPVRAVVDAVAPGAVAALAKPDGKAGKAPVSTSLMPPTRLEMSVPTAPPGAPASSFWVMASTVSASTGASLTGVTTSETTLSSVEKAVLPPLRVLLARPPTLPVV